MESSTKTIFSFSPAMRLVLFMALTGIGMIVGGMISFSIAAALLHVGLEELTRILLLPEHSNIAQFANALASIIGFGLPSIAMAYIAKTNKQTVLQVMGFQAPKNINQLYIVVLIAVTGMLLSGALGDLTEKIPVSAAFKTWADGLEEQYKKALMAMTQMKSLKDLFFSLIAVALIPAIMEELFFRASLQKILQDLLGKPYWAIIVTAIVFSAIHFSYFGFLSRMSLGIVLGLVYYITKTIWMPVLMHFLHNGMGVLVLYIVRDDSKKVETVLNGNFGYYWVIATSFLLYILFKKLKNGVEHSSI